MNKYNPEIHHRHSIRLKGYDYSSNGLFFITICTNNLMNLFGIIENGEMLLNDAGKFTLKCWREIPKHFPNISLHKEIVMPNHIHGVIEIIDVIRSKPKEELSMIEKNEKDFTWKLTSPSQTVGAVIRGFKVGVVKWFRRNMKEEFPIGQPVWQRNYYEHIIRNDKSYQNIVNYILNNPLKWDKDEFNQKKK